ncbi:hypothetical protein CC86DRAFT_359922 [Ophiobolus disseminans]|uniref:FAD binding domain-containing protein n=1 Tax=Ophiobolus disseminans TaxID=1469910 RepID=A0A6A6ZKB7_9PLEO|nr:hypothetical protein CC86DRAFT_359922 [Ophiobolus disseminans]
MARSISSSTWERGFKEPSHDTPWQWDPEVDAENDAYITPPSKELMTSTVHNDLGINLLRTWPTLYDGTNSPHGIPDWWRPASEVDVLICGAGPSGLETALSLVRQGVSFRIIDKAEGPLIAGRADGVQPRFLEILNTWGLAKEVHEEGPIIERTAIYKDGEKLLFTRSHQSDSRYRGLHIITQGQIERIFIRDLLRHQVLVERSTTLKEYTVEDAAEYPIRAMLKRERDGVEETIRAKFVVGSDGAASNIRKNLDIPFDGMSTNIYWGIMDCVFDTDYPHAWMFGSVISSKYGGCVIIPREDGYIRLYTQLDVSHTGAISESRQAKNQAFAESGGNVDVHSITPDEVLEQANRIFAPYKLKFAAPLSWFAIWKISERVARSFSSENLRVHLVGDAAHVHSVMGAFGLNASIMDASNLAWKMGLVAQKKAKLECLMATYSFERRDQACRIIEASGEYLRFVCATDIQIANVRGLGEDSKHIHETGETISTETQKQKDLEFLGSFFGRNGQFLLGVDAPFGNSVLTPPQLPTEEGKYRRPLKVNHGVRAPNPRVCFSIGETGYLYDKMTGAATFHIVIFASSLTATVRRRVSIFGAALLQAEGFYRRFGGSERFNILVVVKRLPWEMDAVMSTPELHILRQYATIIYDDRTPDEDAHTTWGVNHTDGGLAVVRPDLWVGMTALPDDVDTLSRYFAGFLLPVAGK